MRKRQFVVFPQLTSHAWDASRPDTSVVHLDVAEIESWCTATGVAGGTIVRTKSGGVFHVDVTATDVANRLIDAYSHCLNCDHQHADGRACTLLDDHRGAHHYEQTTS